MNSIECTYVQIWDYKVKVKAINNFSALKNIVFTKLVNCLKLLPEINHAKICGTIGLGFITSVSAYSAMPLCFSLIQVFALTIVLLN